MASHLLFSAILLAFVCDTVLPATAKFDIYVIIAVPLCAKYAPFCMRCMMILGLHHICVSVSLGLGVHWADRQQTFEIVPARIPKALRVCSLLYVHKKIDL